jgi:hypothetical protein
MDSCPADCRDDLDMREMKWCVEHVKRPVAEFIVRKLATFRRKIERLSLLDRGGVATRSCKIAPIPR